MRGMMVGAMVMGMLAGGCVAPDAPVAGTPGAGDSVVRRALVVGLTAVDPGSYDGWAGACPGCDVDAEVFGLLCAEQGLAVTTLRNRQATRQGCVDAARALWKGMGPGDLFVLFVSGHGGQVRDKDGDEEDGQDETLCLWDGELSDDVLRKLWEEVPAGVRVLFVTDTCNSGSNYRARSFRRTVPRSFAGALIHFGGCDDGESSYGNASGGAFTTALIDGWGADESYATWFLAAVARMDDGQAPAYGEYGPEALVEAFRTTRALR